ncbi:hypothetical protein PZA11_002498 [Diplocarpon coronariae]
MKLVSLTAALHLAAAAAAAQVSYAGFRAVRVPVGEDVAPLAEIIAQLRLPTWKGAADGVPRPNTNVDLVVPADQVAEFERLTAAMDTEVMHEDLGAAMAAEVSVHNSVYNSKIWTWFDAYRSYSDHLVFLQDLVKQFKNTELITAGDSAEGRPITGIRIWGSAGKGEKPAVVLHSGAHAREWTTISATEFIADFLLSGHDWIPEMEELVNKYEYYIFPIVNPDGFVYSQTTDRLWSKNRQTKPSSSCVGRDISRNWPYEWLGDGSSSNPCSETYRGAAPGDAPETKGLLDFIEHISNMQKIQLFIDFQSYSQAIMTPYSHSCTAVAPNDATLQSLASNMSSTIKQFADTDFAFGTVCQTIGVVNGASTDYVKEVVDAEHVFTFELSDKGNNGFLQPVDQILPLAFEAWAGVRHLLMQMAD